MHCTDGQRFVTSKTGELLIIGKMLHSCDSFHCLRCGKTVIGGVSNVPLCLVDSKEGTDLIMKAVAQNKNCYGR